MLNPDQGHEPPNSPGGTGGQFMTVEKSHPEAVLPTENSTQGTFLYPPINYGPDGVASYIQFWESAPISDRVLSNVASAYKQNRETWIGEQLDKWAVALSKDPEHVKWQLDRKTTDQDIVARHEIYRAQELERLEKERPIVAIPNTMVRGIAIAAQMFSNCGSFTEDEQGQIDDHLVHLSRGMEPMRVNDIYSLYNLAEIIDTAFVDQDIAVQHEISELRKHIGAFSMNE